MKKLLLFIMILLIMVLPLSACSTAESEARADFESMMDMFKTCDKTQIDKYYSFDELVSYLDKTQGELLSDAVLSTLAEMDYKILSSDKLSNTAVEFEVEIKTVDFSEIVENFINKVTILVDSPDYKSNVRKLDSEHYKALIAEQMIKAINESNGATTTKTLKVTMVKNSVSSSNWIPSGTSDEFLGHLFENLSNAVEALA